MSRAIFLRAALLTIALTTLAGCVPAIVVGAAATAMVATDRRSAGVQLDDESIEIKVSSKIGSDYETRVHVNVTSYNGVVLITGEVPDQEALNYIGNLAKGTEKVRVVHNELVVGPNSDLSSRSNDTYITGKVKSRMIEANKFPPNAVKVVTERSVVYLMGLVSKDEGDAAAETAATTAGVVRVVKFFQYPA
ncbi:MAG: BON domain-containing protein [Betaproteobacteria bacterium]